MLKVPLWLASLLIAFECIHECHDARFAGPALPLHHGRHQQQHRRLKGNVTATGRVDVHPPFRLFQALSKKYEISAPQAEVNADATIVVSAFSPPEFSEEEPHGDGNTDNANGVGEGEDGDDGTDGENFAAVRTRKSVPQCAPRPERVPRTPSIRGVDDEDLSERVSAESPSAAATSPDTQVSSDSGSGSSMPLGSGSSALSAGNTSSSSSVTGPPPIAAAIELPPSPSANVTPNSQAPGVNSSTLTPTPSTPTASASNAGSPSSASLGNSSSPGNLSSGPDAAAGFTDRSGAASSNSVNNANRSGPVSTQTSSSSPLRSVDPNRICPHKGDTAIGACHSGLKCFNPTSNSCIAPEDSRCIAIHTGVWGCAFSFSPSSKAGPAASISGDKASDSNPEGSTTLQTFAASSSVIATNFQTQKDDRGGSESQPIVLVVAAIVACVVAVLAVVKRGKQRARQNASSGDQAAQGQETTDFSYYPKMPELSKASEYIHTFT